MKKCALLVTVLIVIQLSSCNLKLSQEEKTAYKDEMSKRKIVRITEDAILQEVQYQMDSLSSIYNTSGIIPENVIYNSKKVSSISSLEDEKEKLIFEAYTTAVSQGNTPPNNFQKLDNENFLYCLPSFATDSTDSEILESIYFIEFERKEIIKIISEK
ncbi:MAG: hypothetical protein OEW75_12125 [Cyclobacteriaceae bacterium]|nr:hypothetical protein [Cyclobacteriaceae bacterium]